MHILFAGGGTAGHINPALAIAGYIREMHPDAHISYIGTADKLEAKLVPDAGYNFRTISVAGFQRKLTPKNIVKNISAATKAVTSSIAAKKILKEIAPDVVIGTGGYVSGPVLRTAAKMGIKTAIHEQNAYPGVTTKMLAPSVDAVMLAMPEAEKYLNLKKKPFVTGNPVRKELLNMDRATARAKLGIDNNETVILSFGGSLGAEKVNKAVAGLIKWHNGTDKIHHIHGTGKSGYKEFVNAFKNNNITLSDKVDVREYIKDMDVCMAAADLVICRAGAITLSELLACGKPSILIPSPYVAENHQFHNAMTLKNIGAAEIIEEKTLTSQSLIEKVSSLIDDKQKLADMARAARDNAIKDTNEKIYKIIMQLYKKAD